MSFHETWSKPSYDRTHITPLIPGGGLLDQEVRQLLCNLADGKISAFWTLWDAYRVHLYHLCLWQMEGVREDAEDALSRCMLRALEKLPRISGEIENVEGWLCRLTINLCVDIHREHRREARRVQNIEDVLPDAGRALRLDADTPEEACLSREAIGYVYDVVNDLPIRLREPFALRFFQEMAYAEIAERLLLSIENVRKRIQQARDILRQKLIANGQAEMVVVVLRPSTRKAPVVRCSDPFTTAP
jgi:RNA polymerase sigma factor (sigma-70 family)